MTTSPRCPRRPPRAGPAVGRSERLQRGPRRSAGRRGTPLPRVLRAPCIPRPARGRSTARASRGRGHRTRGFLRSPLRRWQASLGTFSSRPGGREVPPSGRNGKSLRGKGDGLSLTKGQGDPPKLRVRPGSELLRPFPAQATSVIKTRVSSFCAGADVGMSAFFHLDSLGGHCVSSLRETCAFLWRSARPLEMRHELTPQGRPISLGGQGACYGHAIFNPQ